MTTTTITLDNAFSAHRSWKDRLLAAVESGEVLDVATIKRDDCCDLGRWLHSEGRKLYGTKPQFTKLMETHSDFHAVTGVVAGIVNSKDHETAKALIGGSSQFASASMAVGMAILALKKDVASQD